MGKWQQRVTLSRLAHCLLCSPGGHNASLHGAVNLHAGKGMAWHAYLGLGKGTQALNWSVPVRRSVLRPRTLCLLSTADLGCQGQHSCKGSCRGAAALGQLPAIKTCQASVILGSKCAHPDMSPAQHDVSIAAASCRY